VGKRPDPREPFSPPPTYSGAVELPVETASREQLLRPLARLLQELAGILRARNAGIQRLAVVLEHRTPPATRLTLGLAAPEWNVACILALLRERLDRLNLPEPVRVVGMQALEIVPVTPRGTDLFGHRSVDTEPFTRLVERLRARLGEDAVQGVCAVPDHRPEKAWRPCEPGERRDVPNLADRPLWLLPKAVPLGRDAAELRFDLGPERIETGWWDGDDVTRDYFVVRAEGNARYWVFRERRTGQWYLHGLFA
jgi:protein ImuB